MEGCRDHLEALYVLAYIDAGESGVVVETVIDAVVSAAQNPAVAAADRFEIWHLLAAYVHRPPQRAFACGDTGTALRLAGLTCAQREAIALVAVERRPEEVAGLSEYQPLTSSGRYTPAYEPSGSLWTPVPPDGHNAVSTRCELADEVQLPGVLSDFARTLATDFVIQGILDLLVGRVVEILPVGAAGLMSMSADTDISHRASSSPLATRFEQLQIELGEGPGLAAFDSGAAVSSPDLTNETRFPRFARRASDEGLAATFALPLRHGCNQLGSLTLYRDRPGALDEATMAAAQTMADVGAAYLLNAQARSALSDLSTQLRYDALTGLANRALLLERLDRALIRARRSGKLVAALFADIDQFRAVNDACGHPSGDEVLVAAAARMTGAIRAGDTAARLCDDKFVILCEDLTEPGEAELVARRIVDVLAQPFVLWGAQVEVTVSVGIAVARHDVTVTAEAVVDQADSAMCQAKHHGGGRCEFLDAAARHRETARAGLVFDLGQAGRRGEMHLAYQPIVDTCNSRIIGVEALLRWSHPERGTVPPAVFIPLAERAGLIIDIGRWVLQQACQQTSRWENLRNRNDSLGMSVNISVRQLMSPGFPATVAAVLTETSTEPRAVTLELTESAFIEDAERAHIVLRELKNLGVLIALDDFGTGYSSLSHLSQFPVDIVKIDRSFVANMVAVTPSHAIVSAVIDLSHALGMTVTAEGVETAEQHQELSALGADSCQGYHFARPMSADDLNRRINVS